MGVKPYYEHGGIVIYHGDCREVLPALGTFDDCLVIVDPPYGISHSSSHGATWQDTQIANDDSTELRDWLISHFKPSPMVVFGSWKASRPDCRAMLIWDKGPQFGMGDLSFPWKPSFEEIYIIGEGFKGRRDEGVLRNFSSVSWESKGRRHPHAKPTALMGHFISKHDASLILDPCCGSGPTLEAAKLFGRRAIGIELDERYAESSANRLAQEVLF
jgi:DNA modification methylase